MAMGRTVGTEATAGLAQGNDRENKKKNTEKIKYKNNYLEKPFSFEF